MAHTQNRVALVTGGARGLGRVIAETLLDDGWSVIVCGRTAPDVPIGRTNTAQFETCDVRKAADVAVLIDRIAMDHGRLDLLVNNAGGSPEVPAASASPRFSEAIVALNLLGPLHLSHAAYSLLSANDAGGSIVNIASISGTRPSPGTAAYGAAKAGLLNLTQSLAMEWGPKVRVNAIVVGLLLTDSAATGHYGSAEGLGRISESVPMKRLAHGGDVASVVRFLASSEAAYVSGAQIAVHGGGERPSFLDLAAG
ncbi:MAG: SDR family oxidoreductase [Sphingomonadales bacterium]